MAINIKDNVDIVKSPESCFKKTAPFFIRFQLLFGKSKKIF